MNYYNGDKVNVVIPEGIKVILGEELGRFFKGNYKDDEIICIKWHDWETMETISFPESLEIIGEKAFQDCPKIKELHFPKNLVEIRIEAFLNCTNLKKIYLPESIKTVTTWSFGNFDLEDVYYEGKLLELDKDDTHGAFKNIRHLHCADCEVDFTKKPYYMEDFNFEGTKEEWKKTMGDHWLNKRARKIHCSDGVIEN